VPQVADALSIPVIAAGGIADGRGFAAALALGASGVQVGTAFLAAHECQIHANYKQLVIKAKDTDTIVTGRITGHPVRGIKTKFARELLELEKSGGGSEKIEIIEARGAGALKKAAADGDLEQGSFMAGAAAGMITREMSAAEIVRLIMNKE
jgi:enoyl-[acyl-carrier protein] reductase II